MSDKPLLVLLHGWGANATVWNAVVTNLAQDFEVLTPELPCHGDIESAAAVLAQQIERPAICLGWSLGALFALQLALTATDKVQALILVAATPAFMQRSDWSEGMPQEQLQAFMVDFRDHPQRTRKRFNLLQTHGDANSRRVLAQLNTSRADSTDDEQQDMRWGLELLKNTDLRPQLANIKQPVHLLHGANDVVVSVGAGRYLADVFDAELQLWDETGHAPFLSQPQRFTDWVRKVAA